jgi:threonine dehydrogenase-like Zn-dependent dehydrogenase
MKALVLDAYMQFSYRDVPRPVPARDEVLIGVKACGICGSDVHGMDGSTGRRIPPVIMGHEASGLIVETGSAVKDWKVGDRVTFDSTIYPLDDWYTRQGRYNLSDNRMVLGVSTPEYRRDGAYAEFVAVPSHVLYHIPEQVSFEEAAMVEPAAVAMHAVNLARLELEDTVLVVGAGMVGLLLVQVLRRSNAGTIIAIDVDDRRLELARKFGADHTFDARMPHLGDAVLGLSAGRGVDAVFEVVGKSETVNQAIHLVRKGGKVLLVGNTSPRIEFPLQAVVTRELQVQGSCAIRGEYEQVLRRMASGGLDVRPMISAVAPLQDGAEWFDKLYYKRENLIKVILAP